MSSATVFDFRDARYARFQERTVAVQRAVVGAGLSSEGTIKAALLRNGIQKGPGDKFMGLAEARGARSFDVHEHVVVAPSHLVFFNLASPLLQQVYNALSILQRDEFVMKMRSCSQHMPGHTVLKAFEPEKMGGTTLSMFDYAVLLPIAPTVLDDMNSRTVLPILAASVLVALKALRAFTNALFFSPTIRNDGEHAVRIKPTVQTLQLMGCPLLTELGSLTSKGINWESPSVRRLLELLYRTLPQVQIGPAICELLFEKFHKVSKREIARSNSRDPAVFLWQHRQAGPTGAVVPSVRSVVSSKTPEASAKTHTHNWCGRQRQAANTTQRCEAQSLLASLVGSGPLCCPAQIYPPVPVPQPSGGPSPVGQKHGPNAGHTRQRGVPKTQSKHANKNPRGEGEMHQAHQIRIPTTKRTEQGCGHNSADR